MRLSTYLLSLLLFLPSCQKDDEGNNMPICEIPPVPCEPNLPFIPFQDTCFELPPLPQWPPSTVSGVSYSYPILNPSNPDEFIYFRADSVVNSTAPTVLFKKVNICTGEKTVVYTNLDINGLGLPIWGENDWIVFTDLSEFQLWKMKSNGDSLQQITDLPNSVTKPVWINEGANIIAITKLEGDPFGLRYVFSPEGEIVDTIPVNFHTTASYWNGKLATTWKINGEIVIGYYDLTTKELLHAPSLILDDLTKQIGWLDENNLVWIDSQVGLRRVNLLTGEVTMLLENCDNKEVAWAATSPLQDGMIYITETHRTLLDSVSYYGKTRIYRLDAFTGEQWLVDLED